ncbi:MAG: hypothetical protein LBV12_06500 [Puniceicoccales bacterium]|jgi:predicted transcriptional regulator|nr:hypothetical protein [Puniceicoccales bacterium]
MPTAEQVQTLAQRGIHEAEIAHMLDCSPATVRRLLKPRTAPVQRQGRPAVATLTDEQATEVASTALRMAANTDDTVPTRMAFRLFAAESPNCPEDLRKFILARERLPEAMVRQVRSRITPEQLEMHRGRKRSKLHVFTVQRSLTRRDEEGHDHDLRAMDLITADDAHFNVGFYYPCDDVRIPGVEKFGVRAARAQNLVFADIATGRIISQAIIARYSDAYNQRDIRWAMMRLLRDHGVPRFGFYFERGAWASRELSYACDHIGSPIRHAYSAKGKSLIEHKFNEHQRVMSAKLRVNFGRTRGEFDWAGKDWCAVREGKVHPRELGYLPVEEFMQVVDESWSFLNEIPMHGQLYKGIPDETWERHLAEDEPARAATAADLWQFTPERHEATIRGGQVTAKCSDSGIVYYFTAPWFAALGNGYKVTVCFDPSDPERAAIINREIGARAKVRGHVCSHAPELAAQWNDAQMSQGLRFGELIGVAEFNERSPFINEDWKSLRTTLKKRSEYYRYSRMLYRQLVPGRRRGAYADEWRNGKGDASRMEVGTTAPVEITSSSRITTAPANPTTVRGLGLHDIPRIDRESVAVPSQGDRRPTVAEELFGKF